LCLMLMGCELTKIIEFRIEPQFFSIVWFVVCQLACFYNGDTGL
jgi:hypothetical protein